jgi:hypothetical protein
VKKEITNSIVMLVTLASCKIDSPKEVLFIGNSLTYYHEMPLMLQSIFNEKGIKVNIQQNTLPGISLSYHLKEPSTLAKLKSQDWDYVILQEGTVQALIPEVRDFVFAPSVYKLDSLIKIKRGKTILYQSYPISIYPEKYCYPSFLIRNEIPEREYCSENLVSSTQEFEIIESSFKSIAKKISCDVAPVGYYFELCKKKYPELNLFESASDTHPSTLGAYLIACVFFKQLTKKQLGHFKYTDGLNPSDVNKITEVVDLPYED